MVEIVSIDGPDAPSDLFEGWVQVYAAAARAVFGDGHTAWTSDQLRELRRGKDNRRLGWAMVDGSEVVGSVELVLPLQDNPKLAEVRLAVVPKRRRQGIGTALLTLAEDEGRRDGRRIFLAETEWAPPLDDESGEGFGAARGYLPAQTVLRSTLALPADRGLLEQLRGAEAADGYVLRTCWDGIPQEWWAGRAELSRRMSTDAPLGDIRLEEEAWDEERVEQEYARLAAMRRRVVDTFAVEQSTGRLVGYTQLQVSPEAAEVAYQQDTLVLREHRGHGLGVRLKAVNTLALMESSPQTRVVRTWNAVDNEPMLAVNHQLGYAPDGCLREWQKVV